LSEEVTWCQILNPKNLRLEGGDEARDFKARTRTHAHALTALSRSLRVYYDSSSFSSFESKPGTLNPKS
jgi:hypothetical protein